MIEDDSPVRKIWETVCPAVILTSSAAAVWAMREQDVSLAVQRPNTGLAAVAVLGVLVVIAVAYSGFSRGATGYRSVTSPGSYAVSLLVTGVFALVVIRVWGSPPSAVWLCTDVDCSPVVSTLRVRMAYGAGALTIGCALVATTLAALRLRTDAHPPPVSRTHAVGAWSASPVN